MSAEQTKLHYLCVEIEDMAGYLNLDLWGCTPDGKALRIAPHGLAQPTGVMTREEITSRFLSEFVIAPYRPYSGYLEVRRRTPIDDITIVFRSSYQGEASYDVFRKGGESMQIRYRFAVPQYRPEEWNYTEEDFAKEIAGKLGIASLIAHREFIADDVFSAFLRKEPAARNGRYDMTVGWIVKEFATHDPAEQTEKEAAA